MSKEAPLEIKGMAGNSTAMEIAISTDTHVYVLDVDKEVGLGKLALEYPVDGRICFGPTPGTCIVGSWRENLKAWTYAEGKLLWESQLSRIDGIEPYGKPNRIKIQKEGTIIVNSETGFIESKHSWEEVFFHPNKGHVSGLKREGVTFEALDGRIFQTPYNSFAMMTHIWNEDVFVWGSAEGHLSAYSWKENQLLFDLKPEIWFNVRSLACLGKANLFHGVASGWAKGADYGLFSVEAEKGNIELISKLPNAYAHAFVNQGEYLILVDGGVYRTITGELVKQLDFSAICSKA